jgi:LmbE family N-acetylglucosaminyl deacetylase
MIWEVFYSPHTDDESIAMAGAIARARALRHEVLVVLVMDNEPSQHGRKNFPEYDLPMLRRAEFDDALRALGVEHSESWQIPERDIVCEPFLVQTELEQRMRSIHETLHPVHHHTVWGLHDISFNRVGSLSHGLCANALTRLAYSRNDVRATLYAVYMYAQKLHERRAPLLRALTEDEMLQKRAALDCYRPLDGRPGYGYRSVPELIDGAANDPYEYLIELTHSRRVGLRQGPSGHGSIAVQRPPSGSPGATCLRTSCGDGSRTACWTSAPGSRRTCCGAFKVSAPSA